MSNGFLRITNNEKVALLSADERSNPFVFYSVTPWNTFIIHESSENYIIFHVLRFCKMLDFYHAFITLRGYKRTVISRIDQKVLGIFICFQFDILRC